MAERSVKRLLKSLKKKIAKFQKQQQLLHALEEEEKKKEEIVEEEEEEERKSPISCGVTAMKRKLGCLRVIKKKAICQDYAFGEELGKGSYGCVRRCYSKIKGIQYACKAVLKGANSDSVHQEIEMMRHLSGDGRVVNLVAVYEDDSAFHLVMDLCPGGDLCKLIGKQQGGKFSEREAALMIKEIITLIQYCHHMGVVHRDIKPENILLTASGDMVLADFGFAGRFSTSRGRLLYGDAGTPSYMAPEIVVMGNYYSDKVDIWSAGVILHSLLVGKLPFNGDTMERKFNQIEHANLNFDLGDWSSVSLEGRDLVRKMLTRDPSMRVSADEVLLHPWITLNAKEERTPSLASVNNIVVEKSPVPPHNEEVELSLLSKLVAAVSHMDISEVGAPEEAKLKKPEAKRCRLWDPRIIDLQHTYSFSNPCATAF